MTKLKTSKKHCNYEDCKNKIIKIIKVETTIGNGNIHLCKKHKNIMYKKINIEGLREIKFRAWDKKKKKLYNEALTIGNVGFGEGSVMITEVVEKGNELIWMQFTGLKDKNGKDIYEGDIVKCLTANGYKNFEVIFQERLGMFVIQDVSPLFDFKPLEKIGNIYENKELLK